MIVFQVTFARVRERSYLVAAATADRAIDIALKRLQESESELHFTREDLQSITVVHRGLIIEDTPLA